MDKNIEFTLNGKKVKVACGPLKTLLKVLRDDLGCLEVKSGCEQGECGTCTVILDGAIVNACLVPAGQIEGKNVITVKGLNEGKELHPIQKAFIDEGAVQCGFCTPGLILATKALLDRTANPTDDEIRESVSGNLCRCTGYIKIFSAVKKAAQNQRKQK